MRTEEGSPVSAGHELYEANLRLDRAEYAMRRLHLTSMPLYLSVVLGTACNLDCPFCYQTASDQRLLPLDPLGFALRRELSAFS